MTPPGEAIQNLDRTANKVVPPVKAIVQSVGLVEEVSNFKTSAVVPDGEGKMVPISWHAGENNTEPIEGSPIETSESEINKDEIEKHTQAIVNAVVNINVHLGENISLWDGQGSIVFQNGNYYIVTAHHVIEDDSLAQPVQDSLQVGVWIASKYYELGKTVDWNRTQRHPNDDFEFGFAYIPLTDDLLKLVQEMVNNGSVIPITFDDSAQMHKGDKLAFVRSDLTGSNRLQTMQVHSVRDYEPIEPGVGVKDPGETTVGTNAFTAFVEDFEPEVCEGMSGGPLLYVNENGEVTNISYGLISTTDEFTGPDYFGSLHFGASVCTEIVYARPGLLTDSDGIALGQENMRTKQPDLGSSVKVVPFP